MLQSATWFLRHGVRLRRLGRRTSHQPAYDVTSVHSRTWMFFFLHMSLSILGHTVTLTSPRCALFSRSM